MNIRQTVKIFACKILLNEYRIMLLKHYSLCSPLPPKG